MKVWVIRYDSVQNKPCVTEGCFVKNSVGDWGVSIFHHYYPIEKGNTYSTRLEALHVLRSMVLNQLQEIDNQISDQQLQATA